MSQNHHRVVFFYPIYPALDITAHLMVYLVIQWRIYCCSSFMVITILLLVTPWRQEHQFPKCVHALIQHNPKLGEDEIESLIFWQKCFRKHGFLSILFFDKKSFERQKISNLKLSQTLYWAFFIKKKKKKKFATSILSDLKAN